MTVVLSLTQNRVEVFDTGHDTDGHLTALGRCLRAWIQSCTESLTNLLDARFELISLEEDDEH